MVMAASIPHGNTVDDERKMLEVRMSRSRCDIDHKIPLRCSLGKKVYPHI